MITAIFDFLHAKVPDWLFYGAVSIACAETMATIVATSVLKVLTAILAAA